MSPEHLVELIDQAPIGICVLAIPSLRIVAANRECATVLGAKHPTDLIGMSPSDMRGDDLARDLEPLWRQVARCGRPSGRVQLAHAQGDDARYFDIQCIPLLHADGSVCALMTTLLDVTERRRAEDAAHRALQQAEAAYRRESHISASFQRSLLPHGPICVPGYAAAHTYRPALLEADVGGDFYNLFEIDSQYTGLVIGDVGGKGLDAAVVAARVQHSVTALAMRAAGDPAQIINDVRRIVLTPEDLDRIVTLFVAILDRASGELRYSNAGHEPPLLWRAQAAVVEQLPPDGPAICSFMGQPSSAQRTHLAPGDLLLLYTDGLADARVGTQLFGWERIAALVAEHHDEAPAALIEAAYAAAVAHSRGRLHDDIALVALRRRALTDAAEEAVFVVPPDAEPLRIEGVQE